jgi:hypothetical protein
VSCGVLDGCFSGAKTCHFFEIFLWKIRRIPDKGKSEMRDDAVIGGEMTSKRKKLEAGAVGVGGDGFVDLKGQGKGGAAFFGGNLGDGAGADGV